MVVCLGCGCVFRLGLCVQAGVVCLGWGCLFRLGLCVQAVVVRSGWGCVFRLWLCVQAGVVCSGWGSTRDGATPELRHGRHSLPLQGKAGEWYSRSGHTCHVKVN